MDRMHILVFITAFLFLLPAPALAQSAPVLFFSDLDWGPKTGWENSATRGAAVSVWGLNLGSSRGSSYVTINGAQLTSDSDYAEWGVTGTANGIPRDLERVTFWIPSTAADGTGTISVTVNGVASNTLPFTVTAGTIYFVSLTGGSNSNNGRYSTSQGGSNGPWRDIYMFNPGVDSFSQSTNPSGDGQYIVYVRGGNYSTYDSDGTFVALRGPYGGPDKRKALIAYPGETPVLNAYQRGVIWNAEYDPYGMNSYFTASKLYVTGGSGAGISSYGNYNRIIGNTFQNIRPPQQFQSGTVFGSSSDHLYIYGNYWDNTGYDSYGHCIYIKTQPGASTDPPTAQYVYIGWNEISNPYAVDNRGGSIFISRSSAAPEEYYTNHIYIHDNFFHDGSESDFIYSDDGGRIDYVWIWNNILTGGTSTGTALFLTFGDLRHFYVYNNVFYSCSSVGVAAIINGNQKQDIRFANNIFAATTSPDQVFIYLGSDTSGITTISSSNDLYYSPTGVAPSTLGGGSTNSVVGDPMFRNAAARDFTLQSSSPAIGAGTSSLIMDADSDIPVGARDYNGVLRGSAYDIGAYEYSAQPPQACYELGGSCCQSGQTCSGSFLSSTDCGSLCCTGGACQAAPVCPDDSCNGAETCSSCPQDCPTPGGHVCCSGTLYAGNCCSSSDCTSPQLCTNHECANPPTGGLVLSLPFDEGSGTTAADASGNGNTGTMNGAAWNAQGHAGSSLTFDGVNDWVSVNDADSLDIAGSFTISIWANFTGLPASSRVTVLIEKGVVTSEAGGSNENYGIFVIGGPLSTCTTGYCILAQYESSAGTDYTATWGNSGISAGSWYHIAGVHDAVADTLTLYVNGIQRAQNTVATGIPDTNSEPVEMGENADAYPTYGVFFSGLLDDARIYNRALSQEEIQALASGQPSCIHKSDIPPCDGCISDPELTAFIGLWKADSSDPTLKELMEAIGLWKAGCGATGD